MTTNSHQTAPTRFMPAAKRTALVAGASGLAGGYMLAHLLQRGGWDVVALSRRSALFQPVQVDHPLVAGSLVKPVDVLGQNDFGPPHRFQPSQRAMGIVGQSPTETAPSDQTTRPIPLTRRLVCHEGLVRHRLLALPVSVGITIVRDAGVGAAPRPGEIEKPPMPMNEFLK
jgi:hypothetical protein